MHSETFTKLTTENQQINSELAVFKVVNSKLEKRVINLKKNQTKPKQYVETMWNLAILPAIC